MVKWISQSTSDRLSRVRVLLEAPNILNKKSFFEKAFFIVKNTICRCFEIKIPLYAEMPKIAIPKIGKTSLFSKA